VRIGATSELLKDAVDIRVGGEVRRRDLCLVRIVGTVISGQLDGNRAWHEGVAR
jgi:hypothetical protein